MIARGLVVRSARRTCVARFFALCLLAFAVSPITAPFTTCELTDFTQSQPADTGHHPGRQMAEVHLKAAPQLITIAFDLAPGPLLDVNEHDYSIAHLGATPCTPESSHVVLRL